MDNEIKIEAQNLVDKIYQPLVYLDCRVDCEKQWEYSKARTIKMVEYFITKMPEGSANWLHHRKLVDAINNL